MNLSENARTLLHRRAMGEQVEVTPDNLLRSVVLYDAMPETLRTAADRWAGMIKAVTQREVEVVTLTSAASEEDLWGAFALQPAAGSGQIAWAPGPLVQAESDPAP